MRLPVVAGALLALVVAGSAEAQLTVHDPTNYAQNLLQAARALEQIENQLKSLQNEARNLAVLDLQAYGALSADMARVNGLLTQSGRLAGEVQSLRRQFETTYPTDPADGSAAALRASADARWRNSMESLRRTLEVQAGVAAGLAATQAQTLRLAEASEGAGGALQAAQAGNQLLAVQSKQLADLTALLAAQGQAEAVEQARAAAARADARARLDRFLKKSDP